MRFQSTRPIRGATTNCSTPSMRLDYFNPRAPYGARPIYTSSPYSAATDFNPRAPYGARLIVSHDGSRVLYEFQSTRPIRGATLLLFCSRYPFDISIHAPHTGRDVAPNAIKPMPMDFNPRAPYGARRCTKCHTADAEGFQSTRPIRGATTSSIGASCLSINFNPRAPYGARHVLAEGLRLKGKISIHAPHTGRDCSRWGTAWPCTIFQSTRPIRGATLPAA